jgi:hypothetical protein
MTSKKKAGAKRQIALKSTAPKMPEGRPRPSASTRSRTGYYLRKPFFRMRKGSLGVV